MSEANIAMIRNIPEDLERENKELRTRVAELEKELENDNSEVCRQRDVADAERRNAEIRCTNLRMENDIRKEREDKLQNRLSTLEKELHYISSDALQIGKANKKLHERLSTLLKASEGMEKALERIVEIPDQTDYEEDPCGQVDAMHEKATKALADFRAVKDNMKKGAGK